MHGQQNIKTLPLSSHVRVGPTASSAKFFTDQEVLRPL